MSLFMGVPNAGRKMNARHRLTPEIEAALTLIARIYDCVLQRERWSNVLDEIRTFVEGDRGPPTLRSAKSSSTAVVSTAKRTARLQILMPHLVRAGRLLNHLGAAQDLEGATKAALESLPSAAMLVDKDGVVELVNSNAKRILAQGDAKPRDATCYFWCITRNRANQAALRAALEEVLNKAVAGRACSTSVLVRDKPEKVYSVEIAGLVHARIASPPLSERALVLVADLKEAISADERLLGQHFSLTGAEGRLASLLVAGYTLASAARVAGVASSTVRTQLKSIFRKVGVRRQADLIRSLVKIRHPSRGRTLQRH